MSITGDLVTALGMVEDVEDQLAKAGGLGARLGNELTMAIASITTTGNIFEAYRHLYNMQEAYSELNILLAVASDNAKRTWHLLDAIPDRDR